MSNYNHVFIIHVYSYKQIESNVQSMSVPFASFERNVEQLLGKI